MAQFSTKCLIIGSGPAGYTAAIYAARANLKPLLLEGPVPGGQLTTTTEVENFPGYPNGVMGPQLMEDLRSQAQRFDADLRTGLATAVDFAKRPLEVTVDGRDTVLAETVIIATGATARYLGLEIGTEISRNGRIGLCNLRRLLLPQPHRGRGWRWRHGM